MFYSGPTLLFLLLASSLAYSQSNFQRWDALMDQVTRLYEGQKFTEAVPIAEQALQLAEQSFPADSQNIANSQQFVALVYREVGKFQEAESLLKKAIPVYEKWRGPNSPKVAELVNDVEKTYHDNGQLLEAEPWANRFLKIRETTAPNRLTEPLTNLATLYRDEHKFAEAERLFERARQAAARHEPRFLPDVLARMAGLYEIEAKYAEAEKLRKEALGIIEKSPSPDLPALAEAVNDLAVFYVRQAKYADAEPLYRLALATQEKSKGRDSVEYARYLSNLAEALEDLGRNSEAEKSAKDALDIREKLLGPKAIDTARSLNNLAYLYKEDHKYADAELMFKQAIVALSDREGPELASAYNNLAGLYETGGFYLIAAPLYDKALALMEKVAGPDDITVGKMESNLAMLYVAMQDPDKAETHFERSHTIFAKVLRQQFAYMTEEERLGFLATVDTELPSYMSFGLTYWKRNPLLTGRMYDTVLWQKGLVASSVTADLAHLAGSSAAEIQDLRNRLTAKRSQVAALSAHADNNAQARIQEAQNEAQAIEKELAARAAGLSQEPAASATWQQVQAALGKDEAAVEFVRFQFRGQTNWTDRICYAALILTGDAGTAGGGPGIVYLGDSKELEGTAMADYRMRVAPPAGGLIRGVKVPAGPPPGSDAALGFYRAFWKPIEGELRGVKKVFVSPDGVLNQVSWAAVPVEGGGLLMDKYDIDVVLSTRDLLRPPVVSTAKNAVLIGNPKFDLTEPEYRAAVAAMLAGRGTSPGCLTAAAVNRPGQSQTSGPSLVPLPGTKAEMEAICGLLEEKGWQVDSYGRTVALEEAVKRVRSPRVLHLATHGFFQPEQEALQRAGHRSAPVLNPMLRSGLYFAGAEGSLAGNPPGADMEDGILTAYEAAGLNLGGTELVVLSACQTGLGEVRNGEGVFGLRRALQEAGAGAILMSMWSVPDDETKQLMTLFYRNWLSGEEKHEALHKAQVELRNSYKNTAGADRPDLWAAFVLAGR